MKKLTIIMAQQNYLIGDIEGCCDKIIAAAVHARDQLHADIIVYPELAICGYPPEDLLLRPEFQQRVNHALLRIQHDVHDIHLIIGHPYRSHGNLFNIASVLYNGKVIARYKKQHLPNYSVFDEKRYFRAGRKACVIRVKDVPIGVVICEDLWQSGILAQTTEHGARLVLSLNASPFNFRKSKQREQMLRERQQHEGSVPILYVNCVGGQDELVFDGRSLAINAHGEICVQGPAYQEALIPVEVNIQDTPQLIPQAIPPHIQPEEAIYQALILGTRDYVLKNNFNGVLVGLSGGIDSALTLTIAHDAFGPDNVHAVLMPSRYTSQASIDHALEQAQMLGIPSSTLSIEPIFTATLTQLDQHIPNTGIAAENIQARCRAMILMALSNQTGKLALTTGNKSEMAVGYATLYGDMAGGFAVLKDVLKTEVYRLAHYRNQLSPAIPHAVFTRAPSAELAPNQTDQDTLPPYDILDEIITRYVEQDESPESIIRAGFTAHVVTQVVSLIDHNEYKRRQAAPGVRISSRAFGRDWRYPVTSGFIKP